MKRIFTLIFLILIAHTGFSQSWVRKADFTGNGRSRAGSFTIGDTCYVIAGGSNTLGYLRDCFAYDTATNAWSSIAPYPGQGSDNVVGFSINGKGYAGTGAACCCQYFNDFWEYDPKTNSWTAIASFPGQGRSFDVAFVLGGKGYVGGGLNGFCNNNPFTDFYAYNPATAQWDSVRDCPAAGISAQACGFTIGNKGYVGTGFALTNGGNTWTPVQDFWEFDPNQGGSKGQWTQKTSFPGQARGLTTGFGFCDYGYIGCGQTNTPGNPCFNDFYRYDVANDKWTRVADFAGDARQACSVFVVGKSAFVGLGSDQSNINTLDFYRYTPVFAPAFNVPASSTPDAVSACSGQSVIFNDTSNYAPTNWQWSFPGGIPNTANTQTATIEYDTAGVFNVTLTAWNACDSGTKTFSQYVTVGTGGTLSVTAQPDSICTGLTAVLSIAAGGGPYTWAPAAGLTDSTSASITVGPLSTTTYTVTSASGGNCPSVGQVILTVANNTQGGTITAARDTICEGTPGSLVLSGNSSNTIQWQSSTGNTGSYLTIGDAPADTNQYRTHPLTESTWYRAIVGSGVCEAASDSFELIVPPSLTATFTSTTNTTTNTVTFNSDSSEGAISSYFWDFGDGTNSSQANPTHTYGTDTTVSVCLTIYDGSNCSYTFCRNVILTGVQNISAAANWNIYPNPFGNDISIIAKTINNQVQTIELYDVLGRVVISQLTGNNTNSAFHLNTSSLANGMYYLMIKTTAANYVQKVVKQ